jgi:hypothetical protein
MPKLPRISGGQKPSRLYNGSDSKMFDNLVAMS